MLTLYNNAYSTCSATFHERTRLSSIYPDLHDTVPGRELLEETVR